MQKDVEKKELATSQGDSHSPLAPEREHVGSIWKHPYMIYLVLSVGIALLLVGLTYIASENGLIPSR